MTLKSFEFESKLWMWDGKGAWYFVSLPVDISTETKANYPFNNKGFGSIPVQVTIGNSVWKTSIFPDSKNNCYLLPIKKSVRQSEKLEIDTLVKVGIEILF
jgi:hypothetical protein